MKFVMKSEWWVWTRRPFPGYRCMLGKGNGTAVLPVKDLHPVTIFRVKSSVWDVTDPLYVGTDFNKAKRARDLENEKQADERSSCVRAKIHVGDPSLPDGRFRVIMAGEKKTPLVVPGKDDTDCCLLFIGTGREAIYSRASLFTPGTTGIVLASCAMQGVGGHQIEVAVLLDLGQSIAFSTDHDRSGERGVRVYIWNGKQVNEHRYSSEDSWYHRNDPPLEDWEGFEG